MLLELVELQVDLPEYNLERGRIGAVIDERNDWFLVEFRNINEYVYNSVKLYQNQILKTEKSPTEQGLDLLGIRHFLHMGEQEWALLAVKAPISQVTEAFAEFRGVEEWLDDIPKRRVEGEELVKEYDSATFIEIINNEWTVIIRSLVSCLYGAVDKEAKFLSLRLATQAVYCSEEDTSGGMAYGIYDCGDEVKSLEGSDIEGLYRYEQISKELYDEHYQNESDNETLNGLYELFDSIFCDLGIYVPACFPNEDMDFLSVYGVSTGTIGKVNIMEVEDL